MILKGKLTVIVIQCKSCAAKVMSKVQCSPSKD